MGDRHYVSGNPSGHQNNNMKGKQPANDIRKPKEDKDLIIEENTVYEIDRECYERLRRQSRRRSGQDRKNI